MSEMIKSMFEDYNFLMKNIRKKTYISNMEAFYRNYGEYFKSLVERVGQAQDKENESILVGAEFSAEVFGLFEKRGKVKNIKSAELSLFMIYYVFPCIQMVENENSIITCDGLRDAWNEKFGEKINYTDYETILSGFQTKIFGIPIGKD